MKFTPGPWEVSNFKLIPYIYKKEFSNYEKSPIAKVFDDEEGDKVANARLIAAAPEMLEAIETVIGFIEQRFLNGVPVMQMNSDATKLRSDLIDILKKAKGEA